MFEKSLQDLIKGLRNHKDDPAAYVSRAVGELKKELKSTDKHVKFVAVQKVTYLQMLGFDMGFAAFHVVEVMSAPRFKHRRAGMLAASQVFDSHTEVVLLCTNYLKKELQDPNMYESGAALNCLSNIATRELSRDLLEDVAGLLSSSRPFIRKKAVLTLYKLYLRYPQGLPQTFDRLRERLNDDDMSVVSCTVNVICELSRKNPKNFLNLAPQLFHLLTTSSNNWMLIKIVKLMAALLPEEPRLARKLLEPLTKIIQTTQAKSLLYECIHTVTQALAYSAKEDGSQPAQVPAIVALCTIKLRDFVEDPDQNLKYLGLAGFVNLMRSHPGVVAEHKEMILKCLVDEDFTVRLRALELLTGMVTKRNLVDIVQKLLSNVKAAEGPYRDELIVRIVEVCSRDKYANLSNFAWYMSVLGELAHLNGSPKGRVIRDQIVDVVARVSSIRLYAVHAMASLLLDGRLALRCASSAEVEGASHVLFAACWVVCEFASELEEELPHGQHSAFRNTSFLEKLNRVAKALLAPHIDSLKPFVRAVFVHNTVKLIAAAEVHVAKLEPDQQELGQSELDVLVTTVVSGLSKLRRSEHIQVQSRSVTSLALLERAGYDMKRYTAISDVVESQKSADSGEEDATMDLLQFETVDPVEASQSSKRPSSDDDKDQGEKAQKRVRTQLSKLFETPLAPVGAQAQSHVPIPDGLDLSEPFALDGDVDDTPEDEMLAKQIHSGGGARYVSFQNSSTGPHRHTTLEPNSDSPYPEGMFTINKSSDSSVHAMGLGSRKDHIEGAHSRADDPFYLTKTTKEETHSPENVTNEAHHETSETTASVDLDPGALADPWLQFSNSSHGLNDTVVVQDDLMPTVDKKSRSKAKAALKRAPLDEEAITLSDISLHEALDLEHSKAPTEKSEQSHGPLKESRVKKHKKDKSDAPKKSSTESEKRSRKKEKKKEKKASKTADSEAPLIALS